jgi:hypothetical protein
MSRKGKIDYHFLGEGAWGFRPARGTAARRDARPTAERRVHAYHHSLGTGRK